VWPSSPAHVAQIAQIAQGQYAVASLSCRNRNPRQPQRVDLHGAAWFANAAWTPRREVVLHEGIAR
jgi:hypothetical protein